MNEELEYPQTLAAGLFGPHDVPLEQMPETLAEAQEMPLPVESAGGACD